MTAPHPQQAAPRRLLLVHAHPDDETLGNGATMALYAAAGVHVTLVTCTRGEEGEILVPELAHLASDRDDGLGDHRVTELAAAMVALGVSDHRFLGEEQLVDPSVPFPLKRFRDSGMAWGEGGQAVAADTTGQDAFSVTDPADAVQRLAAVIRGLAPQVVVTYEPRGGYGHPDHVRAHDITMAAVDVAAGDGPGGPAWSVPKVYWNVVPENAARNAMRAMRDAGGGTLFEGMDPDGPLPSMFVTDELVTTAIDGSQFVEAKKRAMLAHATQISVDGRMFALSNGVGQQLLGVEFYQLVRGEAVRPSDGDGLEDDLFAGLGI